METSGKRLFVRGGDCGSNCLFFFFGFCFRRLVEVVIVGGETKRAGVSFFKKKLGGRFW